MTNSQLDTAKPKNGLYSGLDIPLVVIEKRQLSVDCQAVAFELPRNFAYASGHWMDIRFPADDVSEKKTFSFASSPTEPEILIAFKNGVSEFKVGLDSVRPGDTMRIAQYGGIFQFNPHVAAVMFAGGIGIAPFRGMIKEAVDTGSSNDMDLVYTNGADEFPFKAELDGWQQELPNLNIHYINTKVSGRMTGTQLARMISDVADRELYVAGPPNMVFQTHEILLALGANEKLMHMDSFTGY